MIVKTVKKTIQKYNLIKRDDKILIAYSGGLDSTGLLVLLLELQEEWPCKLILGHFNHRLRKKSDEEEQFVRKMAQRHRLSLFLGSEDVRSYAREHKLNLEEAGRELRYGFLKKTAREMGGAKIATGHTMNDQAETFLMRIMRGSGLRGLSGIFPAVEGGIIRPLIHVERQDLEAYLKKKGVRFCEDESNFDRHFLRNRIRLDLIPYLQKSFEPKIIPHIGNLVSIVQEDEAILEKITEEESKKTIRRENGQVHLDRRALSLLPLGLGRRVVRNFIQNLKGNLRGISFNDVESVLSLGEGKEANLKKSLALQRERDQIFLKRKVLPQARFEYSWSGKKILHIRELNLSFEGMRKKKSDLIHIAFDDKENAFLNSERLKFPFVVRNWKDGDRYHPFGSPGRKKVKEIMRAKKIPREERRRRPVFLSGNDIVWILSLPVSEKYKVTERTTDIFIIKRL